MMPNAQNKTMSCPRWLLAMAGMLLLLAGCGQPASGGSALPSPEPIQAPTAGPAAEDPAPADAEDISAEILLIGETHGLEKTYEYELELWQQAYGQGQRDLFVELPYYTAQYLNLWLQADDDVILNQLYQDWKGTLQQNDYVLDFYRQIKETCPGTVFHGTDVGHQYDTTGARYLEKLETAGLTDTEEFKLAARNVTQGMKYYRAFSETYRENTMTENFIQAYDALGGIPVTGIYGSAHTNPEAASYTGEVECMAKQLQQHYGGGITEKDISDLAKDIDPLRIDQIQVNGKAYTAQYYGVQDLRDWSEDYLSREFWRLEDAYDDLKDCPKNGNVLPYDNYPMLVKERQVFVVDYTCPDGSVQRIYYRSDGDGMLYNGRPATEEFAAAE